MLCSCVPLWQPGVDLFCHDHILFVCVLMTPTDRCVLNFQNVSTPGITLTSHVQFLFLQSLCNISDFQNSTSGDVNIIYSCNISYLFLNLFSPIFWFLFIISFWFVEVHSYSILACLYSYSIPFQKFHTYDFMI